MHNYLTLVVNKLDRTKLILNILKPISYPNIIIYLKNTNYGFKIK